MGHYTRLLYIYKLQTVALCRKKPSLQQWPKTSFQEQIYIFLALHTVPCVWFCSNIFAVLFGALIDVPKVTLNDFKNKKTQINRFFYDGTPLQKCYLKVLNQVLWSVFTKALSLVWVGISWLYFLVGVKSSGLKLVRIFSKTLNTGTNVNNYIWLEKISMLVSSLKCIDITIAL